MIHRPTSTLPGGPTPVPNDAGTAPAHPDNSLVTGGRRRVRRGHHHGPVRPVTVLAAAMAAVVVLSSCSLAGKDLPELDEGGPVISRARVDERNRATMRLDEFECRAHSLHRVGPTSWRDECDAGQDNFELHDPEAYRCSVTTVRLYTFSGDFRAQARQVGEDLAGGPCAGGTITDVERTLRRYYDQFVGTKPHNYPQGYTADALPISSGSCVADTSRGSSWAPGALAASHWFTVPIPASYEREDPKVLPLACGGRDHCHDRLLYVRAALGAKVDGDQWAVAVTTSKDYWVVGWDGRGSRPSDQ